MRSISMMSVPMPMTIVFSLYVCGCAKLMLRMNHIIEADHVGKTYRSGKLEVPALRDVSFNVTPGEFVSIVGPSGSGKSTLFYVLGGLTSPTAGTLTIRGLDFSRLCDAERTELRRGALGGVVLRFQPT